MPDLIQITQWQDWCIVVVNARGYVFRATAEPDGVVDCVAMLLKEATNAV